MVSVEPHRSCGLGQYPIFIDMYTSSDLPTSNRAHLARKAPDSADNHPKTPCLPSRTARQGSTAASGAWHRPGQLVWGRRGRVGGGPSPLQLESTGWRLHHPAAAGDGGVCQGANTVSLAVRRRLSRPAIATPIARPKTQCARSSAVAAPVATPTSVIPRVPAHHASLSHDRTCLAASAPVPARPALL